MTGEPTNKLSVHAQLCSFGTKPLKEAVAFLEKKAPMDSAEPYSLKIAPSFPLLEYLAEAANVPYAKLPSRDVFLDIEKSMLDVESLRRMFGGLGKSEKNGLFADWKGEGLYTRLKLRSAPSGKIYTKPDDSIVASIFADENGKIKSAKVHSAVLPEEHSANFIADVKSSSLPKECVVPLLRILASQVMAKDFPSIGEQR